MRLLIDTNAYTAYCKNNQVSLDAIQCADEIILPLIVLAELRAGFFSGAQGVQNEAVLERFMNSPRVRVGSPDESTTFIYARLHSYLKKQGTPIPTNDLWIAATTVHCNGILLTFDKHFEKLPQVPRWQ